MKKRTAKEITELQKYYEEKRKNIDKFNE